MSVLFAWHRLAVILPLLPFPLWKSTSPAKILTCSLPGICSTVEKFCPGLHWQWRLCLGSS